MGKAHAAAKQAKKQRHKLKKKQAFTASQQDTATSDVLPSASDSQHSPQIPAAVSTDKPQRTASPEPHATPVLDAGTPCQQDSARPHQSPPGPARPGPSDPGNHFPQDCLPSAYQKSTPCKEAINKGDARVHADDTSHDAAHSSPAQLQCMTGNDLMAAEGVLCPSQPSDTVRSAGAIHRLTALHPHLCCPLTQVSQGLVCAVCAVHKQACCLMLSADAVHRPPETGLECPEVGRSHCTVDSCLHGHVWSGNMRAEVSHQEQQLSVSDFDVQELLKNPVIATDGFTYEEAALRQWLHCQKTSPVTGGLLDIRVVPNRCIKTIIDDFQQVRMQA